MHTALCLPVVLGLQAGAGSCYLALLSHKHACKYTDMLCQCLAMPMDQSALHCLPPAINAASCYIVHTQHILRVYHGSRLAEGCCTSHVYLAGTTSGTSARESVVLLGLVWFDQASALCISVTCWGPALAACAKTCMPWSALHRHERLGRVML